MSSSSSSSSSSTNTSSSKVIVVESPTVYQNAIANAGFKLVVAEFTLTNTANLPEDFKFLSNVAEGPTSQSKIIVDGLSNSFPTVVFLRVNLQTCADIARIIGIFSIPTIVLLRKGQKIQEVNFSETSKLETLIKQHMGTEDQADLPAGHIDLQGFIELPQVDCLNESQDHTKSNVLSKNDGYLESDCDEQLLLCIPFLQKVKIHSLIIKAVDKARAPKQLRLYVNKPSLDFESAESTDSAQDLELNESQVDGKSLIPLKFMKFQNVNSLSFFVVSNQGGVETTAIQQIRLIGKPEQTTNMDDFKKASNSIGE